MIDLIFSTDSTAYSSAHFGQNNAVIIALDDVACTVLESRLIDCLYDSNTADCTHSQDAGVQCVARELQSFRYMRNYYYTQKCCLSYRVHTWQHQTERWFH